MKTPHTWPATLTEAVSEITDYAGQARHQQSVTSTQARKPVPEPGPPSPPWRAALDPVGVSPGPRRVSIPLQYGRRPRGAQPTNTAPGVMTDAAPVLIGLYCHPLQTAAINWAEGRLRDEQHGGVLSSLSFLGALDKIPITADHDPTGRRGARHTEPRGVHTVRGMPRARPTLRMSLVRTAPLPLDSKCVWQCYCATPTYPLGKGPREKL